MLKVVVWPESDTEHISQIYAGLYELAAQRKIRLKFSHSRFPCSIASPVNTLWMEAHSRRVCFDMMDGRQTYSMDRLHNCDIYFKRSLDRKFLSKLDPHLQAKVRPYGLNYACRSPYEVKPLLRELSHRYIHGKLFSHPLRTCTGILKRMVKTYFTRWGLCIGFKPILAKAFEVPPCDPAEAVVLFQSRLYDPKETGMKPDRLRELNTLRAETTKALKAAFGAKFKGGMSDNAFARKYYPDLITKNTGKREYLQLVRRCLVSVTTNGLHSSTGWKLPEYLAASRCIVTEPLLNELPRPLECGKNFLAFRTPQECVAACKSIINDSVLSKSMRHQNWQYYMNEVHPAALIWNCLKTVIAFSKPEQRQE